MGRLPCVAVLAAATACVFIPEAHAHVDLAGNGRGDQLLLHQVLGQVNRPLFAGARPAGGPFGPLTPVSPAAAFAERAAVVDDSGGAVIAWRNITDSNFEPPLGAIMTAVRRPGGDFGPPVQLAEDSSYLQLFGNARGDALATWYHYPGPPQYSFRPAGGEFGAAKTLADAPVGVAVENDGTAVAVFWEYRYPEPDHLVVAERLPGGEFGPTRPIPETEGASHARMGAAPNGRSLLAWRGRASVFAMERLPGGDFGPAVKVRSQRADESPVSDVQITPAGAATIARDPDGSRIAVRPAGGSFAPFVRVAFPLESEMTTVSVNDRGDAAAAWHGRGGAVRAAYRSAGRPSWSKRVTVAGAPPFVPATYSPPAIALADSGQATVTWEESDGATVRTYVRDLRGRALGRPRLVHSIPTYFAEGPPSACRPAGGRVLRRTRSVTVFKRAAFKSNGIFGCLRGRGAPVYLGDLLELFPSHTMSIAGPLVAYGYNYFDRVEEGSAISVTDLRDPEFGLNRDVLLDTSDYATLVATRLRANGSLAWISCPDPTYGNGSARECRRVGRAPKHIWVWEARRGYPRLADRGRAIDPRTFRLRGSTVTWRKAGKRHSARLR
jgi:hypothetical protein